MMFSPASTVVSAIVVGKLIGLVSAATTRPGIAPDLPTMAVGWPPRLRHSLWFGLVAPPGTPREVIDKLIRRTQTRPRSPVPTQNSECRRKCRVYLAFGVLSRDSFDSTTKHFVELLLPHLRKSLELRMRLDWECIPGEVAFDGLDRLSVGILVIDSSGRLLFANNKGEILLHSNRGLAIRHGAS
jgi:hypothetical protein